MKYIHRQEHEQFKKLFTHEHTDNIEDRFKVLEAFLQTEQHVTSTELVQILNDRGHPLEPGLVRETLKLMCRYGFAQKNRFRNGEVRYEHRHLGQHHDHMVCTKCRGIFEFKNEQLEDLQVKIAATYGFHMLQHKMEIYGICAACLKERVRVLPLDTAKQGEKLIIKDILGGAGVRMRLLTMGLRQGDQIDIVTNISKGQLVVAVEGKRFVLGRGLSQKILVQPAEKNIG
ncbi:MAG: transcriptional repressor [Desulfobacterales bacterium]|nr:transcriptional repressor [Desulfobacterales bacterium]